MNKTFLFILVGLFLVGLSLWLGTVFAKTDLDPYFNEGGKAIEGYDPVAYFDGKPKPGSGKFIYRWEGVDWHFSSQANLKKFQEDPEKYAPQYGGYCAWAVSKGYTASIDPEAWTIYKDKLYLNYSKSVQGQWSRDIPGNVRQGDKNWPRLLKPKK